MAEQSHLHRLSSTSSYHAASERPESSRLSDIDIFGDDFTFEPFTVTDGFRPLASTHPTIPASIRPYHTRRSSSPESLIAPPRNPRRTSIRQLVVDPPKDKPRSTDGPSQMRSRPNSFTLRHDGPTSRLQRRAPEAGMGSEMSELSHTEHRPLSTISNALIPQTPVTYHGAAGPSHPYGMYPQDTAIPRSPSVATTVPAAPVHSGFSGPSSPTHPYGMYPQTTTVEPEVGPVTSPGLHFPVGFPGHGNTYERRLGPDGEEADDIIGVDGHTEQLPPYSRYADEVHQKAQLRGSIASASTDSPDSPRRLIDVESQAGSVTQENAETSAPASPTSPRDDIEMVDHGSDDSEEQMGSKEKWTARSKRRSATPSITSQTITVTNTVVDATSLASIPSNLPKLPDGPFGLPIEPPAFSSSQCLGQPGQQIAWGCAQHAYLDFVVTNVDYGTTEVLLASNMAPGSQWHYGPQPPSLNNSISIKLMQDKNDSEKGPAYFFQQAYDKIVIIPDSLLSVGTSSKRSPHDANRNLRARNFDINEVPEELKRSTSDALQPGESPWFCFWNGTVLEGFIYVTLNTSAANSTLNGGNDPNLASTFTSEPFTYTSTSVLLSSSDSLTFSSSSSSSSSASYVSTSSPSATAATVPATSPQATVATSTAAIPASPSSTVAPPSTTIPPTTLSTIQSSPSSSQDSEQNSAYPSEWTNGPWGSYSDHSGYTWTGGHHHGTPKRRSPQTGGVIASTMTSLTSSAASATGSLPPPYPKVIKIEERRQSSNIVTPYCAQMSVQSDGSLIPALNATGEPIVIILQETEPAVEQSVVVGAVAKDGDGGDGRHHKYKSMKERKADPDAAWWARFEEIIHNAGATLERRDSTTGCRCEWLSS
ncbi:hypothetical protein MMC25_003881 [Agyrium rufum]|nr:hypothetical protein [Agyrium rufum]